MSDGLTKFIKQHYASKEKCGEHAPKPDPTNTHKYPKYFKDVTGISSIDVYKVHELFDVNDPSGAIHHASKKLLLSGVRTGGKSKYDDIKEARDTLDRWLEINNGLIMEGLE